MQPDNIILLLSDARGIYIPRDFSLHYEIGEDGWQGISTEEQAILADPDHEDYWEVWHSVLSNASYFDKPSGKVYHLHQDGDLWALSFESMTDEERINFGWDL